jgi:amidophosphoribosyltransferase
MRVDPEIGHYCGLFGVFGDWNAPAMVHAGLQALQHRGQESAGIASADGKSVLCERGAGLVTQALSRAQVEGLRNPAAIGHVRYGTSGGSDPRNIQPLLVHYRGGAVAVAHNGDLVNKRELRRLGEAAGAIFQTSTDTETILALLARAGGASFDASLHSTLMRLHGAFSLLLLRPGEMHAIRDRHGFRPLSLGRKDNTWFLASETCAFTLFGAEHVRDLEPGEHVTITDAGLTSTRWAEPEKRAQCIFEHIYFARPDSKLFGENVHRVRERLGRRLAAEHPAEADIVVPVPESGLSAAQGFSCASGIPMDKGFVKNHYVGRTFISPGNAERKTAVMLKLAPVPEVVRGKRIVVVDDSIVRGTTSLGRIKSLREAGATEVHFRISCPPVMWPCFYGIDFPTREELIASNKSVAEIAQYLGVDSLGYLSFEGLMGCVQDGANAFCSACFDGNYPTPLPRGALPTRCP